MLVETLYAKDHINPLSEATYYFITQSALTPFAHNHDFQEVFLVLSGSVNHYVNGIIQHLVEGSLVFIRKNDCHYYEKLNGEGNYFINVAFLPHVFDELFSYIKLEKQAEALLDTTYPPLVNLTKEQTANVKHLLESLAVINIEDHEKINVRFRYILFELFTKYFTFKDIDLTKTIPLWLSNLRFQMQKVENFTAGIELMQQISGKNTDYLSRAFKHYYNETPTDFINRLRLDYAVNLLLHSDNSIIDIAFICGFNNLSHFYHKFREEFNRSPASFRKHTGIKQKLV